MATWDIFRIFTMLVRLLILNKGYMSYKRTEAQRLITKFGIPEASSMLSNKEENDCVVRAVSHAFDVDYIKAHHFCEMKLHRKSGKGTYTSWYLPNIKQAFGKKIKQLGKTRKYSDYKWITRPQKSKVEKWVGEYKGKMAETPADAAKDAEYIFTCVGNDNDLREVTFGENGVFKTIKKDAVYIDNTTASATIAREIYDYAKKNSFGSLDAPVSGGQAGAENGALTVMIGGDQSDFDKAKDKIDCYSKKMKLLGKAGSGQLAKMVNQICIAGLVQGLSEGINFGMKAGLNMDDVIEVISKGAAQSWQMENRYKTMIDDKFDFGFAVDWMRKDLKIAMDEAKNNGSLLPITELVDKYYGDVQEMGGKRWDTSSLIKRFRK